MEFLTKRDNCRACKGKKLEKTSIMDIAPTMLHILGIKVPGDMDGKVLVEMFKKDSEPFKRQIKLHKSPNRRELEEDSIKKAVSSLHI